jgi:hypothetical protein
MMTGGPLRRSITGNCGVSEFLFLVLARLCKFVAWICPGAYISSPCLAHANTDCFAIFVDHGQRFAPFASAFSEGQSQ